jgi:hypothetical protein
MCVVKIELALALYPRTILLLSRITSGGLPNCSGAYIKWQTMLVVDHLVGKIPNILQSLVSSRRFWIILTCLGEICVTVFVIILICFRTLEWAPYNPAQPSLCEITHRGCAMTFPAWYATRVAEWAEIWNKGGILAESHFIFETPRWNKLKAPLFELPTMLSALTVVVLHSTEQRDRLTRLDLPETGMNWWHTTIAGH